MTRSILATLALAVAMAAPLAASAQPRPADLQRGLVAAYPLDGEAVDEVTRFRAPAVATRPAEDRHGARGGALWFDGARSTVNLGAALQPARFTISAWIRPETTDRVEVIVSRVKNLPGHWQKNLELRLNAGGRLFLHVPSGQGWEGVEGTRPVAPGRWTHVAATYDGARAQLFVDGAPDGTPLAVRYEQTATETFIGARPESGGRDGRTPSGPTFFFHGALDDVRVWDRPLADVELAVVAARVPPAPPAPPRPPPGERAPLAVYPLDGDAGDATGGPAGALVGTRPAEDRAGNARGALAFGGKDHVDLGVRVEPERLTLAVWARPARGNREQVIFSKLSTAPGARERWLELKLDSFGRAVLTVPSASPFNRSVTSSQRLASGRWVHLAATFDGETAALYVGGEPAGEARVDAFEASRGRVFLGARPDAAGKRARSATPFEGRLDDLRVFRGALSADDVARLARVGDERPPHRRDDEEGEDALLVRVGKLLVRYDAACVRGDPDRIARAEEKISGEIEEAARAARGDRELVERLRHVARELDQGRGRADAMSLDRKRSALFALSESLWNDLARELDDGPRPYAGEPAPAPRQDGW